jgi:hypothetical protein
VIALYRRFTSLDRPDRRLVLEAASLMAFVSTGLRLLSFSALRRILDHHVGSPTIGKTGQLDASAVGRVRWAITAVAARFPSATCLVQALAADAILRRKGLACELRIGVRVRGDSVVPVEAHAWVECDGAVVIGAIENLSEFQVLPGRLKAAPTTAAQ